MYQVSSSIRTRIIGCHFEWKTIRFGTPTACINLGEGLQKEIQNGGECSTKTHYQIFIFSSVRSDIFLFLFLGSNTYSSVVLCATDEICSVILNNNISDVVTRQRTPQLLLIASCSTLLRSILHEEVLIFLLFVLARCGEPYYTITNLYASTFFDSQVCCLSCLYFF